jgi:uncharacterized protein
MRVVRWRAAAGDGLEHLVLNSTSNGTSAYGVVIGNSRGVTFGLCYAIDADADWFVSSFGVTIAGGRSLKLLADGHGHWRTPGRETLPTLTGCVDVDLATTPFTNTLPIRRLNLARGERRTIRVVYVTVPGLELGPAEQAYTCVEPGRRYRYESLTTGYKAELDIDADGLIIRYPGLWQRVA